MELQGRRSDGWQDAASDGWPLGLQPVSARVRPLMREDEQQFQESGRRSDDADSHVLLTSTPSHSSSSSSSSDCDTKSTSSFFLERSRTLGSLIGIASTSELDHPITGLPILETTKRPRKGARTSKGSHIWSSFMGCAGALQEEVLLSLPWIKRNISGSSLRQATSKSIGDQHTQGGGGQEQGSTFDNDETLLAPQPSGRPPLRLILYQPSLASCCQSRGCAICSDLPIHHQGLTP